MTVTTPLQKAGAYLVTARMEKGNTSRIVIWVDDTVLVKKTLADKAYYFVADTRTGEPVRGPTSASSAGDRCTKTANEYQIDTKSRRSRPIPGPPPFPSRTRAPSDIFNGSSRRDDRRPRGHLGFTNNWFIGQQPPAYDQSSSSPSPTGRSTVPVPRSGSSSRSPTDTTRPTTASIAKFLGAPSPFEVHIPRARRSSPGVASPTPSAASTARSNCSTRCSASTGFIPGGAAARSGSRSTRSPSSRSRSRPRRRRRCSARTSRRPSRRSTTSAAPSPRRRSSTSPPLDGRARWYPGRPWDWLFGSGYWWFAADSTWYPGWSRWGVLRPVAWWWWAGIRTAPPEVVAEAELPIPAPTATLHRRDRHRHRQEAHPDQDHRYEITAESHRPVAAPDDRRHGHRAGRPQALRVYTWVDRGHYRAGDTIEVGAPRRRSTTSRSPARGRSGCSTSLMMPTRKPVETPVESWDLTLDADGQAHQSIKAGPGPVPARVDDRRRLRSHDRGRLPAHDHRPGVRRRELPIQRPGDHPREEGIPARRDAPAPDQHQSGELHRPALRPADERRLPAAEGRPPARQEHRRGDRHRPGRHAQHLRRGADGRRRQGPRRDPRDRHPARVAGRRRRGRALAEDLQARPESRVKVRLTGPDKKPFVGLDRADRLRQGRRVHLGRFERPGYQRVLLEMEAVRTILRPSRASTAGRTT